jgi:hypothetical protein
MLTKTTSEATYYLRQHVFVGIACVGRGGAVGGEGCLLARGGKIKQAVLPYRAYLPNSHLTGRNISISEES